MAVTTTTTVRVSRATQRKIKDLTEGAAPRRHRFWTTRSRLIGGSGFAEGKR